MMMKALMRVMEGFVRINKSLVDGPNNSHAHKYFSRQTFRDHGSMQAGLD